MHAAIILAGCGRADGTEITEAVSVLVHCARVGMKTRCFAPNQLAADCINHATGKTEGAPRHLLVEAARISRGDITPIDELSADRFDVLIFPGGFGAAKNLCDFASRGEDCSVHPHVRRVVDEFHAAKRPIGFICIAPVIGAKVLGTPGKDHCCTLTIGTDPGTAAKIEAMGAAHAPRSATECVTDEHHRVVSAPAYMHEATPYEVFVGIGKLVDELVRLATSRP